MYNTMLSGMEAEVPNKGEIKAMETCILGFCRTILGIIGLDVVNGVQHRKSNRDIWLLMELPTIASE